MLAELSTVKTRLALDPVDATFDVLLLRAIIAISARFDQETNRTLARTENALFEFPAEDTEIAVPCYPIESVAVLELKTSEAEGWVEQSGVDYLIRRDCIVCLDGAVPLNRSSIGRARGRLTYTGGYLVPGSAEVPFATRLPADLEQAVVEQTVFWFQTRDKLGLLRQWPKGGTYEQFVDTDLLPSVRETLRGYTRFVL
jgi:hypothetical protein